MPVELIFIIMVLSLLGVILSLILRIDDGLSTLIKPFIGIITVCVCVIWMSISFSCIKHTTYTTTFSVIQYPNGTSEQVIKDGDKIISITKEMGLILSPNHKVEICTSNGYGAGLWWSIHNTYSITEK